MAPVLISQGVENEYVSQWTRYQCFYYATTDQSSGGWQKSPHSDVKIIDTAVLPHRAPQAHMPPWMSPCASGVLLLLQAAACPRITVTEYLSPTRSSSAEMSSDLASVSLARGPLIGTFLGLVQVHVFAPYPAGSHDTISVRNDSLYGITCMQAFFYFRTYGRDTWRLKMTVRHPRTIRCAC